MIKVYKFDSLDSYTLDARVLTCAGGPSVNPSFSCIYSRVSNEWVIPIPKSIPIEDANDNDGSGRVNISDLIESKTPKFTFQDKLYIHSDCTIPRAKVTQKYTRVLNPAKADVCVVPTPRDSYPTTMVAIFVNSSKGKIYTISTTGIWKNRSYQYIVPSMCKQYPLGTKVTEINPLLKTSQILIEIYRRDTVGYTQENWKDFLESTLVYAGHAVIVPTKEKWIGDFMYRTISNVITESQLLPTLGDQNNEITQEIYDSLKEMLNSTDMTVVDLGLKTLAELDYKKYHNTAIHLLCHVTRKWWDSEMRKTTNVKYMLNELDMWSRRYERYTADTTIEDFTMLKKVVEEEFQNSIAQTISYFKDRFPFANIATDYSFSVTYSQPSKSKPVEETDI